MNKTKLIGERAYLSEIFLELEGINDLAKEGYNIYGVRFKEYQMKLLRDNVMEELATPLLWIAFLLATLFFLWVWS